MKIRAAVSTLSILLMVDGIYADDMELMASDTLLVPVLTESLLVNDSPPAVRDDSLSAQTGRETMGAGKRIAGKVLSGTFWGVPLGAATTGIGFSLQGNEEDPSNRNDLVSIAVPLYFSVGYALGVAIGVTRVDPYDRFLPTLVGSFAGAAAVLITLSWDLGPSLVLAPMVMATIVSEKSRKPPESRRVSVSLVPDSKGGLSAVAILRF